MKYIRSQRAPSPILETINKMVEKIPERKREMDSSTVKSVAYSIGAVTGDISQLSDNSVLEERKGMIKKRWEQYYDKAKLPSEAIYMKEL